jgi:hypothetical protein
LNLSIALIIKPQALDKASCDKCNGTKRDAGRARVGRFSRFSRKPPKKFQKSFKKQKKFKKLDFIKLD